MKRLFAAVLLAVSLSVPLQAWAELDIREGYARPTFAELIQTVVMLKGMDINDTKIADEYARLLYCNLYEKNFGNDVAWNRTRSQIVSRVLKKREYYRVKYEVVSPFNLQRYDFRNQVFPLTAQTALNNVGVIKLYDSAEENFGCSKGKYTTFVKNIAVQLSHPLTVTGFSFPTHKVEKMMVRIEEEGNTNRLVYGRIRVIVSDMVGIGVSHARGWQQLMKGEVTSVDFFLDRELTKPIGGIQLARP